MEESKEARLVRIRELFTKLKLAYDWIDKNQHKKEKKKDIEGLIKRSKPIIAELETLGVDEQFSYILLLFGVPVPEMLRVAID